MANSRTDCVNVDTISKLAALAAKIPGAPVEKIERKRDALSAYLLRHLDIAANPFTTDEQLFDSLRILGLYGIPVESEARARLEMIALRDLTDDLCLEA